MERKPNLKGYLLTHVDKHDHQSHGVLDDDSTRISRVLRTIVMPCNVIPSEYWVLSSDSNNGVIND